MSKNPIAYHFPSWKNPYELRIMAIEKRDNNAYIIYEEYTGFGYKPHKKRIYSIENDSYFLHNGGRIRFSDCDKVIIDENSCVQRTGESLTM